MSGLNVKLQNGGTVNINTGEHIDNIKKKLGEDIGNFFESIDNGNKILDANEIDKLKSKLSSQLLDSFINHIENPLPLTYKYLNNLDSKKLDEYLELRETIRPYVTELMKEAHEKGTPVMRPLFYDYPEDTKVWEIEDEYMFGPDMLVAPILYEDMRERTLYLPEGDWVDINSKTEYKGGDFVTVAAPLDTLPVFVKRGTHPELV